jgi:hypothetical protein
LQTLGSSGHMVNTIKWNAKNLESVHLGVVCVCVCVSPASCLFILYPNGNMIMFNENWKVIVQK